MIVAISGATGFIGKALIRNFTMRKWSIRVIDRVSLSLGDEEFLKQIIEGAKIVINLAGAPITKKWTPEYKKELIASRVNTTMKIADAIAKAVQKPKIFISASAIGIYNSTGTHTENSASYSGSFLAKICTEWEKAAFNADPFTRLVIFRLGIVLGKDAGALEKMQPLFRVGLGGKLGSGKQAVSFIHISDLVNAFFFAVENEHIRGIVNAVSPYPSDNTEFTAKLARVFKQPAFLTVPSFALKLMYGEGAQVLLEGQRTLPEKLLNAGFRFEYPTIQNALVNIFSPRS